MPTTYSPNLKISLPATGELAGTWGTVTNTNLGTLFEQAIVGAATVAMADANQAITITDGASSDGRAVYIKCTGARTAGRNLTVPTVNKNYIVENATTGGFAVTVKTAAGTGIAVAAGTKQAVYADGTNVVDAINGFTTVNGVAITKPATSATLTIADGKTLTASNTLTFTGTDGSSAAFGTGGSVWTKSYVQTFTASGTYTPHAGMIFCMIECIGGGGGGGSMTMGGAGFVSSAGGGGSGGYSRKLATAADIGASQTVTVGAGGSATVAGGETSVGTLCVAKGGGAGLSGSGGGSGSGGPGATTTGAVGDITIKGSGGQSGFYATIITVSASTTMGGAGYFGGGSDSVTTANSNGSPGNGYGSGGGGAYGYNSVVTRVGGTGASGVVIITEYCNQ